MARNLRIALAGILHESNSFSAQPTTLDSFRSGSWSEGDEIGRTWAQAHHEVGGFLEGADRFGFAAVPTLVTCATPSGMVRRDAVAAITARVLDLLSAAGNAPDGLLLALHGAMVLEGSRSGDAEILRRFRHALGPRIPVVCTLDFHANVPPALVELANILVIYQTNPHTDQRERGIQAARLITRIARSEIRPTQAMARPPMILPIRHQNTSHEPLRSLLDDARAVETMPDVLAANVTAGFPYADVPDIGPCAVVVTDGAPEQARAEARRLSERLWSVRSQLTTDLPDAAEAVRLAIESDVGPIVLAEMGDNIGGGSAGDGTFLLSEILRQGAERSVVVICDPEAVRACSRAGTRNPVDLTVGGKTDTLHGAPVHVSGQVRCLHDGIYEETEVRHGGKRFNDQGLTAVIETPKKNLIVLTSRREPPFSLQQLISLGIDPSRQRILVVKAAIAFRAAYEPIARRIIEVDTPGSTTPNPKRLDYHHVPRPIFPLDPI